MQLSSIGTTTSSSTESTHKHGGCPKGKTDINKRITAEKEKEVVNDIAIIWNQQVNDACERGIKSMPNRSLKILIQERKIVHNIMTDIFPEAIKCPCKKEQPSCHQEGNHITNGQS